LRDGRTNRDDGPEIPGVYSVVAILVMVAVLGSGAVSFNAVAASSTTDIDIELVPKYREVTYTLDPIVIPQ